MSYPIDIVLHKLLEGESISDQIDILIEASYSKAALAKRLGFFVGAGAGGGALANYIRARGQGMRGRRALRAAGRGAVYGGLAGAGVGGAAEYGRHVLRGTERRFQKQAKGMEQRFQQFAKEQSSELEGRFKRFAKKTAEEFDVRIQKRYAPLEKMGRASQATSTKLKTFFGRKSR